MFATGSVNYCKIGLKPKYEEEDCLPESHRTEPFFKANLTNPCMCPGERERILMFPTSFIGSQIIHAACK